MSKKPKVDFAKIDKVQDDFDEIVKKDVESLIRLHEKDNGQVGRKGEWLEALRRSAVVLLASNVEFFIETIICEALMTLCDHKCKAKDYPEKYRLWIFSKEASNRNLNIEKSRDIIEVSLKLWSDVRELQKDELKTQELKDDFANPTPKNVNWIMGLLGYEKYLDVTLNVNGTNTKAETLLGELAQRRNDIAHGVANQRPTLDDIQRLRKFAVLLANRIHKDINLKLEAILYKGGGIN